MAGLDSKASVRACSPGVPTGEAMNSEAMDSKAMNSEAMDSVALASDSSRNCGSTSA